MLISVNYGHNQTIGFKERHGQSLVKICQTRSNLIDGLETTGLGQTGSVERFSVDYWVLE